MSFQPSSTLPPIKATTDNLSYYLQGEQFSRGDSKRTMSRSELAKFGECPSKWIRLKERLESTDCMKWGSLVDVLTLTPERFSQVYAVAPETYPATQTKADIKADAPIQQKPWNRNANYCEDWEAKQNANGLEVIKADWLSEAKLAVARLHEDKEIRSILECSNKQFQINVDWHDEATGLIIPFKCLLDIVPHADSEFGDTLFDLKTTNDASLNVWTRRAFNDGLHYQAACYLDAINAATGLEYRSFSHIIQESDAPYEPTVRMLDSELLTIGRIHYRSDLARYCQCLANNKWPGFDRSIVQLEAWMLR